MTTPAPGQGLDPQEEELLKSTATYWRQVWNETPVQTITRLEDVAKQLIAITTGLQGLYVAIFVFSNLRTQVEAAHWIVPGWLLLLLFFVPLLCWLASLFYAARVFVPRIHPEVNFNEMSPSAWQKVKDAYGRAAEAKYRWLQRSHQWLIGSFVLVLLAVIMLVFLPSAPTQPTPLIIVTPTPVLMPSPTP